MRQPQHGNTLSVTQTHALLFYRFTLKQSRHSLYNEPHVEDHSFLNFWTWNNFKLNYNRITCMLCFNVGGLIQFKPSLFFWDCGWVLTLGKKRSLYCSASDIFCRYQHTCHLKIFSYFLIKFFLTPGLLCLSITILFSYLCLTDIIYITEISISVYILHDLFFLVIIDETVINKTIKLLNLF